MNLSRRSLVAAAGMMAIGAKVARSETENSMSSLPFAATTPVSVSRVGLKARDAENLAAYYRSVVGLQELSRDGETITLGAAGRPLLVIENDPNLRPDDPRSAGLFHTAFLLPERADLGRWINHAIEKNIAVEGASDHMVSEALYITDPEGNGIEIYADRSPDQWKWSGKQIEMATLRMDIPGVRASVPEGDAGWKGMPENSIVGHVHLRVGNPDEAESWWNGEMGFDTVKKYGADAVFLSTGGYHHHIAGNTWHSRGAGLRDKDRSGLSWVELVRKGPAAATEKTDPWGNVIRTVAAA
jgi:catechol 2,3-dioxygenase